VFAVWLFKTCTPCVCTAYCSVQLYTRDGQNNGNTRQYRNKTVGVGCTERTLVVSIFGYSFVLLHSVNVSALQIVFSNSSCESTTKREYSQIFQIGQLVGAHLAGASVTKMATLLGVFRAAVSKVMTAYTNHGTSLSSKRNSGCKTKTK
jgi:hypothetical protein